MGSGGCSQFIMLSLLSGWGLLTLFPCFVMGCLPQKTVLHELFLHESFQRAAVLHKLLHCDFFTEGAALQEQADLAWISHSVTSPDSRPAPVWASLSSGSQVLLGVCSSVGFPWCHCLSRQVAAHTVWAKFDRYTSSSFMLRTRNVWGFFLWSLC